MLSRTTFILAPIALLLTLSLIIVIPSVFSSAIKPNAVYNTLIYEISKDLSENIEFYNTKCDNWNNNYTLNIEDMNNTQPEFYNYQMCSILYQQLSQIPILDSRSLSKNFKQYQIARFLNNLVLLDSPSACYEQKVYLCSKCGYYPTSGINYAPACSIEDQNTLISNELGGKLSIYVNLGI